MLIQTSKSVTIRLPEHITAQAAATLRAYQVDGAGKLLETASFSGHSAQIGAAGQAVKSSRLFIGPEFPADFPAARIDAYALAAVGAYQVSPAAKDEILVQNLPATVLHPIPVRFCNIQGNISNIFSLNGVSQSGPVCKAKVHICSVEWVYHVPIWLRPVIPHAVVNQLQGLIALRRAQPKHIAAASPKRLPVSVEEQILAATPHTIQGIVAEHATVFWPFLCHYPIFWPWFLRVVEQDIVYTDCNGHFDDWRLLVGTAAENVYVWAEASIDGNWVTIYNPPYPCNTLWNYASGTEINISLSNAAIPPCNCDTSVIDGTVWFTAIGSAAIATSIQQDPGSTALGIPNGGCTNVFDSNQLAPFGGTLDLWLASGAQLPASHYRWSWTLLDANGNPTGAANFITGAALRYYLWQLPDDSWESGSISLQDTDSDGNIAYFLPDYDVTSYPGVPALAEWVSFNFLSASLDSTKIPNGSLIRLNLELLNLQAGVFTPVVVPQTTFQVSNSTDAADGYGSSSAAPAAYLDIAGANASGFTLIVRVDNSPVTATINDAWLLDGQGNPIPGGNSGPCGFIQFSDPSQDVSLSFVASEPFNYATFSYNCVKGDTGTVVSAGGYVFADAAPFTLAGGAFTDTPTVLALLSGCTQAAYGETLSVSSLATDGSSVLAVSVGYPYAASAAGAFALTPAAS